MAVELSRITRAHFLHQKGVAWNVNPEKYNGF